MKNKWVFSIFLLFVVTGLLLATKLKNPNRELIILLDNTGQEQIALTLGSRAQYTKMEVKNPQGIGAMTMTALLALHQKAAPIVINTSLLKNIVDHNRIFHDIITLDARGFYQAYKHHPRFSHYQDVKLFKEHADYTYKNSELIKDYINNSYEKAPKSQQADALQTFCKQFTPSKAPSGLNHFSGDIKNIGMMSEMIVYMISYTLKLDNWTFKKINDDLVLCIPSGYIIDDATSLRYEPSLPLTDTELLFGLKVNHLPDIDDINAFAQAYAYRKLESSIDWLENLFVTKQEYTKYKQIKNQPLWALYAAGHGFAPWYGLHALPQLKKLKGHYEDQIDQVANPKPQLPGSRIIGTLLKPLTSFASALHSNLSIINREIGKLEATIPTVKECDKGVICSLNHQDFSKLLHFFNDSINTAFFFYTSCFAGGDHMIHPYLKDDKPFAFNYPIVSGTVAENMSFQEMPCIKLPPYASIKEGKTLKFKGLKPKDVDAYAGLKILTTLQFKDFFDGLRSGLHHDVKKYKILVNSLHPYVDKHGILNPENICNIPSVRLAGSTSFHIMPYDDSFEILDAPETQGVKAITLTKHATLLHSHHIKAPIIFKHDEHVMPACISLLPGLAAHTFESIEALDFTLDEALKSFMVFPELSSSKIFWIKKLTVKPSKNCAVFDSKDKKTLTLNDVIIMRNICNSDTLVNCKPKGAVPFETAVYASDNTRNYKITCKGQELSNDTMSITPYEGDTYKHELIAYCPELQKSISPVLA